MKTRNVAASVRQRLLTLAQAKNWEFNRVVQQAAIAETTPSLPEVVGGIRDFLGPLLASFQAKSQVPKNWRPKQGWF